MWQVPKYFYSRISDFRARGPVDFYCKYVSKPSGLIHVGAHLAQERDFYSNLGFHPVFWIESNPSIYNSLLKIVGRENCALGLVWSEPEVSMSFKISNNSVSSSVYDFEVLIPWGDVRMIESITLMTTTLNDISLVNPNFFQANKGGLLVLDVQGAELPALEGAGNILDSIHAIVCEISKKKTYVNGTSYRSLDSFLRGKGFVRMGQWVDFKNGHGDALYVSQNLKPSIALRLMAKGTWLVNFFEFLFRYLSRIGILKI